MVTLVKGHIYLFRVVKGERERVRSINKYIRRFGQKLAGRYGHNNNFNRSIEYSIILIVLPPKMDIAMTKENKIYVRGMVKKEVVDEFMLNAIQSCGYTKGFKGISLEQAMIIFNLYFKVFKDIKLINIAEENNLEPWEVAEILIKNYIDLKYKFGLELKDIKEGACCHIVAQYMKEERK